MRFIVDSRASIATGLRSETASCLPKPLYEPCGRTCVRSPPSLDPPCPRTAPPERVFPLSLVLAQVQNARRYRASVPTSACFIAPSASTKGGTSRHLRLKGDRRYAEEVAAQPAPASPSMSDSPLSCTPSKHAPSPRNEEDHRGGPLQLCDPPLGRAPRSLSDRRRGERQTKTPSLPPADAPPLGVNAERWPRPSCLALGQPGHGDPY